MQKTSSLSFSLVSHSSGTTLQIICEVWGERRKTFPEWFSHRGQSMMTSWEASPFLLASPKQKFHTFFFMYFLFFFFFFFSPNHTSREMGSFSLSLSLSLSLSSLFFCLSFTDFYPRQKYREEEKKTKNRGQFHNSNPKRDSFFPG